MMTRVKLFSILALLALILTLPNLSQRFVAAAAQPGKTPQATPRFVVFEAFLSAS
jgi:hypothetical protein